MPYFVFDVDVTYSPERIIDMLSLAKEFGDVGRLAHFIAVFSGSTVTNSVSLLSHRCISVAVHESTESDMRQYVGLVIKEYREMKHLTPFSEKEMSCVIDTAVECLGLNYLTYKEYLLDFHKSSMVFKTVDDYGRHFRRSNDDIISEHEQIMVSILNELNFLENF